MSKSVDHNTAIAKVGYKKTKLGWIPEEWNVCTFGDIADPKVKWSITGGPFGSDLKAEHYLDEGIRIIQLQNIGDGKFRDNSKIYTSLEKANQLLACNIFPGEIILSKMGDPVARACKIPDTEMRWVMGSDGIRLVVDETHYDKKFVLDYINYSIFRKLAISRSTGSTRRRIGLVDLKKIPFIQLPLPEQQKIASILNTWDTAIAAQEQLIKEKQALKKGLMQDLLTGKKRFDGFSEEWEEVKLMDMAEIKMGQSPDSKSYNDKGEGIWLIQGNADIKNRKSKPRIWTSQPTKICEIGETLMTVRAPVGAIAKSMHRACIGRGICSILSFESNDFIHYQLLNFEKKWAKYEQGSTFTAVGSSDIKNLKLLVPRSTKEQEKISFILKSNDDLILKLVNKLKVLKQQKQGLMQQLLTGGKRVKV